MGGMMEIFLRIEMPDDEDYYWMRVCEALDEYKARVRANNEADSAIGPVDRIGMDKGPNTLICARGVRITERVA